MVDLRPKSPYEQITTPENLDIHANLTDKSWAGVQTLRARSRFFKILNEALAPAEREGVRFVSAEVLDDICDDLIRTTGSIEGKHRESTTQAVQGQKAPTIALGAVGPQPGANGHVKAPVGLNG